MTARWQIDLRHHTAPVEQQGSRGTCLAVATTAGRRRRGSFSSEFLHHACAGVGGRGLFESADAVLGSVGQPPESQRPYDAMRDEAVDYEVPAAVVGPYTQGRLNVASPIPTFDHVRERIGAGGSIVLGVRVLESFFADDDGLLLPSPLLPTSHAVLCVGTAIYEGGSKAGVDPGDDLLCVQNSWGELWGDGGYGYVPASSYSLAARKVAEIGETT